jgi:hypothetical protein
MCFAAICASAGDGRARRAARWSAVILLALAGCVGAVRLATAPTGFDHAGHGKRDLGCTDCHATAKSAAAAGMPAVSFCTDCHDPKEKPPKRITDSIESYRTALARQAYPSGAVRGLSASDVIFDHKKHDAAKVDCVVCHAGVTTAGPTSPNPSGPLAMSRCVKCHEERGASTDCATCHKVLRKDTKPPSHERGWLLQHGPTSRIADRANPVERCDTCHARSDCDQCHAQNPPRDHTNPFRVATHGLSASMDRSRCMSCHRQDSCDRCHETEPPRSHKGTFGAPKDTHCLTCHDPISDGVQACIVCHKGTPSHALAPPKPAVPVHSAAMNCRQCHGNGAPFPHVDNGTNCNTCHH